MLSQCTKVGLNQIPSRQRPVLNPIKDRNFRNHILIFVEKYVFNLPFISIFWNLFEYHIVIFQIGVNGHAEPAKIGLIFGKKIP